MSLSPERKFIFLQVLATFSLFALMCGTLYLEQRMLGSSANLMIRIVVNAFIVAAFLSSHKRLHIYFKRRYVEEKMHNPPTNS